MATMGESTVLSAGASPLKVSSYASPHDNAELQTGVIHGARGAAEMPPPETRGVDHFHENSNGESSLPLLVKSSAEEDQVELEPVQLPQSTLSLLFSESVYSLGFWFGAVIAIISFTSLFLVLADNFNPDDVPANVTPTVRAAQYLAILVALLMEEEIPTGLYLLRMIPRQSLHQKLPRVKYGKFIFSSILRLLSGYIFLFNVMLVLAKATGVLEIFYDVLALQFVQRLDDIAFSLATKDVFGKRLQRACTAKCFHDEFENQRLGRSRNLSIFLKTMYFVNLCIMLVGMVSVTVKQIRGDYHQSSITIDFGNTVWDQAWVLLPPWLPSFIPGEPGQYQTWTLVYSYFNGVYSLDRMENGRPVYKEMRKCNRTSFETIVPAEIKFCDDISAWIVSHESIHRSKSPEKAGCNWILRSPETTEFDLLKVVGSWQVWVDVIGKAEISIASNICRDETDCNLNGDCNNDGKCECHHKNGVQYMGTHCEVGLRDSCQTIIGEAGDTFSVVFDKDLSIFEEYGRPVYYAGYDYAHILLIYSGNRWFGTQFLKNNDTNATDDDAAFFSEYHSFWYRAYSTLTLYVSDPTSLSIPVGVDFYEIVERGDQFGPFGALKPLQLWNQTGRGYFRCSGPGTQKDSNSNASRPLPFLDQISKTYL